MECAVTSDLDRYLREQDRIISFEEYFKELVEERSTSIYESLLKGQPIQAGEINYTLHGFLAFLDTEEIPPQKGIYFLAIEQIREDPDVEASHQDITDIAKKLGYL